MICIEAHENLTEESIINMINYIYDGWNRPHPDVIAKPNDYLKYKLWLCNPANRKNDLCIFGIDHKSNGIQTSIVVSVLPQACPECGFPSEDPVIASRATAMLIFAMYLGTTCPNCQL